MSGPRPKHRFEKALSEYESLTIEHARLQLAQNTAGERYTESVTMPGRMDMAGQKISKRFSVRTLILLAALIGIAVLLGFVFTRRMVDFPVYYAAGKSLISGRGDLYSPTFARSPVMDYRYPPFFLISFLPLWHLGYPLAAYIWYGFEVLDIAICVWAVRSALIFARKPGLKMLDRSPHARSSVKPKSGAKIAVVSVLITGQYFVMSLHYGNAQLLATALLLASLYLAVKRRDVPAGLLMALSIAIKLVPVLLLPYFFVRRRWKYLACTTLCLVAINLAPAVYFGFRSNIALTGEWYRHVIADQEFHEINGPINLSLKGQMQRSMSVVPYQERLDGDVNYPQVNFVTANRETVGRAWIVADTLLYISGLLILLFASPGGQTPTDKGERAEAGSIVGSREMLELGLMVCLMLLAAPLTSKIYFAALLWPVASLAYYCFGNLTRTGATLRRILKVIAAISFLLPLLPGRFLQRFLLVLGADFYLTFLLMIILAWADLSIRTPPPAQDGERRTPFPPTATTP
ncbi:MAG: glycosyltransferase family 87 protein [Blastocatellia bacterium]